MPYCLIVAKNFLIALLGMFLYLLTREYREIGNNISKNFISLAVVMCLFPLGMIIPVAELVYREIKVFQEIQFSQRFSVVTQAIIPYLFAKSIGIIPDDNNTKKFPSLPTMLAHTCDWILSWFGRENFLTLSQWF